VHAWALTINRSQGQTLARVLLDLRHAPFEHGQAYVAISRVRLPAHLAVFVNASCCLDRNDGSRCAVLATVVYPELLATESISMDICQECQPAPAAVPPATTAVRTAATGQRRRLADFMNALDDSATARRVRRNNGP